MPQRLRTGRRIQKRSSLEGRASTTFACTSEVVLGWTAPRPAPTMTNVLTVSATGLDSSAGTNGTDALSALSSRRTRARLHPADPARDVRKRGIERLLHYREEVEER